MPWEGNPAQVTPQHRGYQIGPMFWRGPYVPGSMLTINPVVPVQRMNEFAGYRAWNW